MPLTHVLLAVAILLVILVNELLLFFGPVFVPVTIITQRAAEFPDGGEKGDVQKVIGLLRALAMLCVTDSVVYPPTGSMAWEREMSTSPKLHSEYYASLPTLLAWGRGVACDCQVVTDKDSRHPPNLVLKSHVLPSHRSVYRVAQKRGQWAILSNCKYSQNSTTEFRGNWWTFVFSFLYFCFASYVTKYNRYAAKQYSQHPAKLYAEHSH